MSGTESFQNLIADLEDGDRERAARLIFDRFANRLISMARDQLHGPLHHKVDPESVVQSVYGSFFRGNDSDQYQYDTWENLWGLLTILTLRKCYARADYYLAQKRNVNRETSITRRASDGTFDIELAAAEPAADEAATLVDLIEQLMSSLSDREQEVASLLLQDYSLREISDGVKLSERSVGRIRNEIRNVLEKLIADETSKSA
jgi:RNA polymerase sigma-70 factor (ECF subfamily)